MAEFNITTVPVPEVQVTTKPNPWTPVVEDMVKNGEARQFTAPNKSAEDAKAIESEINKIQKAARAAGKSARKQIAPADAKGNSTVTVWLVDRITRERKNGE